MNNTQFAMAVAHALSQVGKTGNVLTSEEVQAIHHIGEMCLFCGYQLGLASPFATLSF